MNSTITDIDAMDAHLHAALVCLMTWCSSQGRSVVLTHGDDFAAHRSHRTTSKIGESTFPLLATWMQQPGWRLDPDMDLERSSTFTQGCFSRSKLFLKARQSSTRKIPGTCMQIYLYKATGSPPNPKAIREDAVLLCGWTPSFRRA